MAKIKEKKKKVWIKIIAPKEFGNKVLGETIQKEEKKLLGRTVKVSLSHLTHDMKKQNVNVGFVVNSINEGKANTEIYSYHVSPSHLKRLVRKAKEKVDDSFEVVTSDKVKLKIKPFMLTRQKTSKSNISVLRKKAREIIIDYAKKNSFTSLIRDVISNKIQMTLKQTLRKLYPLSLFEIRAIERVK